MEQLKEIPPVTRVYLVVAFLTTSACALDLLSPFALYFSAKLVFQKYEVWRLVSTFCFFGSQFNIDFLFHMFFLVRYSRSLEESARFRGKTADYVYFLLLGAVTMLFVAPWVDVRFLGSSLTFMMVYLWARRNPYSRMALFGLFEFKAPYLPWVLLGFSFMLGGNAVVDVLGIAAGHIYYFLEDVYPRMLPSRYRVLATPRLLEVLFDEGAAAAGEEEVLLAHEHEHQD